MTIRSQAAWHCWSPCGWGSMLLCWSQVFPGGFAAVDTGIAGCQSWPSALYLASPISNYGCWSLPPAFTADASGAALQPAPDSSGWENLITVQDFVPTFAADAFHELSKDYAQGSYSHIFPIQPRAAVSKGPPVPSLPIANILIEIGMPADYLINTSDTFRPSGKLCCPEISLSIVAYDSSFPAPAPIGSEQQSGLSQQNAFLYVTKKWSAMPEQQLCSKCMSEDCQQCHEHAVQCSLCHRVVCLICWHLKLEGSLVG